MPMSKLVSVSVTTLEMRCFTLDTGDSFTLVSWLTKGTKAETSVVSPVAVIWYVLHREGCLSWAWHSACIKHSACRALPLLAFKCRHTGILYAVVVGAHVCIKNIIDSLLLHAFLSASSLPCWTRGLQDICNCLLLLSSSSSSELSLYNPRREIQEIGSNKY